jgi:hypothetical protein
MIIICETHFIEIIMPVMHANNANKENKMANCNLPHTTKIQNSSPQGLQCSIVPLMVTCWPYHELFHWMELHYTKCMNWLRIARFGVLEVLTTKCTSNINTYRECVLTTKRVLVFYSPHLKHSSFQHIFGELCSKYTQKCR